MIPIAEFQRRAHSGPVMKESDFDKALSRKLREIVSRYGIKYDPEAIIADDALADAVFEAGVDLLVEVGLYHRDTQRVIQVTKDEVLQLAREIWQGSRKETFGKGKDAVTVRYRTAADPIPPAFFLGTMSTVSTAELYVPWLQSFASEESSRGMMSFGTLPSAGGLLNKAGTPGEMACVMAEVTSVKEVARRAGKPGMFFGRTSATTPAAIVALFLPGGLERHNGMVSVVMNQEQKLDWGRLVLAMSAEQCDVLRWITATSLMGGLCRGPEDGAVMVVASLLSQLGYGHATFAALTVNNREGTRDREGLWAHSAALRASERHIGVPTGSPISSAAGSGTEMALHEKAALTICYVASGSCWIWGAGSRRGIGANVNTGLEGRIAGETAPAVAGMPRDKANDLLRKVLALYQDRLGSAPAGKTFAELYDVARVEPTAEYLEVYGRAKEQLARMGVPYR